MNEISENLKRTWKISNKSTDPNQIHCELTLFQKGLEIIVIIFTRLKIQLKSNNVISKSALFIYTKQSLTYIEVLTLKVCHRENTFQVN